MKVTVFPLLFNSNAKIHQEFLEVLDDIKNGKVQEKIEQIRKNNDEELKKTLPCICFSGVFNKRKAENLQEKSGLICLDYDNVEDIARKKQELINDKYTRAVFISPRGNGLKQIIEVNKDGSHGKQFLALQEFYPDIDPSGKDISRICFMSYDPDIYINKNSLIWYQEKRQEKYQPKSLVGIDQDKTIGNLLAWFDRNYNMAEGTRNNSLFTLACTLLEFGINDIAEILQEKDNGLEEKELNAIEKSARERVKESFGSKKFEPQEKTAIIIPLNSNMKEQEKLQEKTIDLTMITGEVVRDILSSLYVIKRNEVTQRIELNSKDITDSDEHIMYDKVNTYIKINAGIKKELTKTAFLAGLHLLAQEKTYNPLQEFFAKNKWDGQTRLQDFLGGFKDSYGQSSQYIYKWLLGAIEKLHNPHFQNEVLVFEGRSGIGKTRTVSLLAKPFTEYTRFGGALNPDNKDHKLELTNNFIYEWGEGSNISKRSEDSLKELLTASYITERPAYARHPITKPVIASIIMTKNSGTFLRDDAEKRRFNILYLDNIDEKILNHEIEIDQVWLEAYELWKLDYSKNWNYVDQQVKDEIFESAMDRPAVWDMLDRIVVESIDKDSKTRVDEDGFTLEALNTRIEELNQKWDRNKYGNRKDIRAYFKRKYNVEPKKSRICSKSDEPPYFCLVGFRLKT
jgi:hypothetical protein